MAEASLGHSIARGASVMVGVSLLSKLLASVSQLVLGGLLLPDEFGLVALTLATTDTVGFVQKIGLRDMLMHRQDSIRDWVNPAMWAAGLGGLLTLVSLSVLAPLAPWVFAAERDLVQLILVAAIGSSVVGVIRTLEAVLAIHLQFKKIGAIQTGEVFVRLVLQIVFAFAGFGAMSIVLPRTITWILHALTLGFVVRPRLLGRPELAKWRSASSDCVNLLIVQTAQVAVRQGDYFLLGIFASQSVVGAYYFAFNLSTQAIMLIAQSLTSVLASGLGKLKAEKDRQIQAFLNAVELISFVAVPLLVMQAIAAEPMLKGFYASKWDGAVVPLQILSIAACWSAVGWNSGAMFAATGRFRQQRIVVIVGSVLFTLLITLCAWLGDEVTVALGVLVFRTIFIPIQIGVAAYGRPIVVFRSIQNMLGPLIVAGIAAVPAVLIGLLVRDAVANPIGRLFADTSLESFVGISGKKGAMIVQVVVMSVIVAVLYNLLSRMILPGTYARFSSRIRMVMPFWVASRVPGWLI